MIGRLTPVPRSEALGTGQTRPAGDVGHDAVAVPEYTTAAPLRTPCLMTWLRCHQCCRGFFASGAPRPHPCLTCAGGRLLPMGLWDVCPEAAPPVMFQPGEV